MQIEKYSAQVKTVIIKDQTTITDRIQEAMKDLSKITDLSTITDQILEATTDHLQAAKTLAVIDFLDRFHFFLV